MPGTLATGAAAAARQAAARLTLAAAVALSGAAAAQAQTAENVAVVINEASPASKRVGEHYVSARGVPAANVIRITAPVADQIDRAEYARAIEGPIAAALTRHTLQDRILYLVLTKGVPLRILGTLARDGTMASVDSELTLLYRRMTGRTVPVSGPVVNPYFLGGRAIRDAQPFTHRAHDIYLVSRLDGFTAEDAMELVNRGLSPTAEGRIVLDQRAGLRDGVADGWLHEAAQRLRDLGHGSRVVLEETSRAARDVDQVLGYYSWASNDPENRARRLGVRFVPGALVGAFVSTAARTFGAPPEEWAPTGDLRDKRTWFAGSPDSLAGDFIREGATGVAGSVAEPFLDGAVRPDILFPAYLAGFTLVESFYLAMPHLGWQTVVVGDPLCRPFNRPALTRTEIEAPTDQETGLPGLFWRHRLDRLRETAPGTPEDALVRVMVADSRVAKGDLAGARSALEEATSLAPDLAGVQLQLALLYEQAGEHARAVERYRLILKVSPSNAVALNNLAYSLAVRNDAPAEALPLARRAAALQPKSPVLLDTLAWVEHLNGNSVEAARIFREILRGEPAHAEIRLHAAIVFAATGDETAAQAQLKEALRLDPAFAARDDVKALRTKLAR